MTDKEPEVRINEDGTPAIESHQDSTKSNSGEKLDELDRAIIRYKVANPAIKGQHIADMLGVHRDTINKRLKKPGVALAIEELQKTALQTLLDAQAEAARRMVNLMRTGREEKTILGASKEILKGVLSENVNLRGFMAVLSGGDVSPEERERIKKELEGYISKTVIDADELDSEEE
jgi:hypothetical protein